MWQPGSQASAAATSAVGTWPRESSRSQAIPDLSWQKPGPASTSPSRLTGDVCALFWHELPGKKPRGTGIEQEMTLGLHDLPCATGLRLLRSLESGESHRQVLFNRSTTYAGGTSHDVILVLHASSTFALPLRAIFRADRGIELTLPWGLSWWLPHARPQDSTLVSTYLCLREFV